MGPLVFDMPSIGETKRYRDQSGRVVEIKVDVDDCSENPLEMWDEMGTIYSFNRRHANFLELKNPGTGSVAGCRSEAVDVLDKIYGRGMWVRLGYFEHGNCIWFPWEKGLPSGTEGDFRWDGCDFAGVWVPPEVDRYRKFWPIEKRRRVFLQDAESACEVYTQWVNGEVYWFSFTVKNLKKIEGYQQEEFLFEDACGGCFGWENLQETLMFSLINHGIKQLKIEEKLNEPE